MPLGGSHSPRFNPRCDSRYGQAFLPRWKNDFTPSRALGDNWIRGQNSLALEVPSAALRLEWNVLVNPLHPAAAQITAEKPRPFIFDARMFR